MQIGDVDVYTTSCAEEAPIQLTIQKIVIGLPANITLNGNFDFTVLCQAPDGTLIPKKGSITWPATSVSITGVPIGSTCYVTEAPIRPTPPTGYQWDGIGFSSPPNGKVVIGPGKENTVAFRNVLRTCEDKGSVIITKTVKNPPPGFDKGDFEVTLNCWTGTGLVTKVETLTYPGMLTKTVFDLPIGSTCTIAETNWRLCPPDQATSGSRPCFPFPQDRSLPIRLAVSRCRS